MTVPTSTVTVTATVLTVLTVLKEQAPYQRCRPSGRGEKKQYRDGGRRHRSGRRYNISDGGRRR
jgi:hypothetical protein